MMEDQKIFFTGTKIAEGKQVKNFERFRINPNVS